MSDIFISYASEDRDRILPLVQALEKTEWSVFWDRTIPAGKTWRHVISAQIQNCGTVVVVWTESSVDSEWVLEEAEIGKRRKILVPVLLDGVEPPFGFGTLQAANLAGWNGDDSLPAFTRLVTDIATILGPAPAAAKKADLGRRSEAEERGKAEEERVREQERERMEEEARRKAREENERRAGPGSEQTWFQRRLAMVRRLYGPATASAAVAVVIALIVLLRWPPAQPNKETVTDSPSKPAEPLVSVTVPTQKQEKTPTEAPPSPALEPEKRGIRPPGPAEIKPNSFYQVVLFTVGVSTANFKPNEPSYC